MKRYRQLVTYFKESYHPNRLYAALFMTVALAVCLHLTSLQIGVHQPLKTTQGTVQLLDLMPFRDVNDSYIQLEAYSEKGRSVYWYSCLILDSLFPLSFGMLFIYLLVLLYRNSRWEVVINWPLLIVLSDLLEYSTTAVLLLNYPNRFESVAQLGSIFTSFKWSFIVIFVGLLGLGLGIRDKKKQKIN